LLTAAVFSFLGHS